MRPWMVLLLVAAASSPGSVGLAADELRHIQPLLPETLFGPVREITPGSQSFRAIPDVDLSFLLVNPKLLWRSDPFFRHPGYSEVTETGVKLSLSAIAGSDDEPMAIINGQAVIAGDWLGNYKVADIGDNYVVVESEGTTTELVLPPLVKRRAPAQIEMGEPEDEEAEEAE